MSKPLTIEELKALKVGDWVWIKLIHCLEDVDKFTEGQYLQIYKDSDDEYLCGTHVEQNYQYSTYGTKWLAYKNKEQAEAKGEIVELPCIINRQPFWYVLSDEFVGEIMQYKYGTKEQAERRLAELKGE